ncbi:MAG: BadF/BadG/BcrA/BcrD ATPase family protein [Pseudomonadota bacterium]
MQGQTLPLLIGVDGGGTGCRAAIAQMDGAVLGMSDGGPANVTSNPVQAIENIRAAIGSAAEAAGMAARLGRAHAYLGLAGAQSKAQRAQVASAFDFARIEVAEDISSTVHGALAGRDGIVISAGTGTIAASLIGGVMRNVSGWGFHVSDQASGAWLGRAALERALEAYDGLRAHSDLTRALLLQFEDEPNAIARFASSAEPVDFAGFAPLVLAAAEAKDAVGRALMERGADHICRAIGALGGLEGSVCLTGGVGPSYAPFLPVAMQKRIVAAKGTALDGALFLAGRGLTGVTA